MPKLLRELKKFYAAAGRSHLPWRLTRDPYCILVSEIMLQQTQVDRVVPFYTKFTQQFPTAQTLAAAKLPAVLRAWQGLGYNRRAKYLHQAAKRLSSAETLRSGEIYLAPARRVSASQLKSLALPGVGPYTRGAVLAFAYNRPEVFIETNIRTVLFYHPENTMINHSGSGKISDAQLLPVVALLLKKSNMPPREFYAALMDYGSYLKKSGVKLSARSKHYTKQSAFEGSARQLRGAILREVLKGPVTKRQLIKNLDRKAIEVERQLARLKAEGLVAGGRTLTPGA